MRYKRAKLAEMFQAMVTVSSERLAKHQSKDTILYSIELVERCAAALKRSKLL